MQYCYTENIYRNICSKYVVNTPPCISPWIVVFTKSVNKIFLNQCDKNNYYKSK